MYEKSENKREREREREKERKKEKESKIRGENVDHTFTTSSQVSYTH